MSRYSLAVIRRIAIDLFNCTRLMGNPLTAYGYLRSGQNPQIGSFGLGPFHFQGRKEDWIAVREVLVEDEYSCIERLFPPDASPRVLDLGANIGCFALRVFLRCPMAQVVSVEAADDTFQILEANKLANASLSWQVLNNGVWREDGPLTLMRRGISVGHRVIEGAGDDAVQGIALRTLLGRLGWDRVDLIKMDIEGGEEAVVPAALDVLRNTRVLIIEIHNDRIDSASILSVLRSVYAYHWQLNDRKSSKPLYIMANELLELGTDAWRVEV
ncbi:MAG: FkbM family methyltransferase [Desulfurivibrionaceae bacterium]|jgi:FkbM family methyltransferase